MEETHRSYLNTARRGLRSLGKAINIQIIFDTNEVKKNETDLKRKE
jgi:hypothetical protein